MREKFLADNKFTAREGRRIGLAVTALTLLIATSSFAQVNTVSTSPSRTGFGIPYPPAALATCASGITTLEFVIGVDGLTKDIKVIDSSGNDALDQASVDGIAKSRWRAATQDGKPVEASKKWRVTWNPDFNGKKCVPAPAAGQ